MALYEKNKQIHEVCECQNPKMFVNGTVRTNVSIITKINYICTTIDFALYFNIYTFMIDIIDIHITFISCLRQKYM